MHKEEDVIKSQKNNNKIDHLAWWLAGAATLRNLKAFLKEETPERLNHHQDMPTKRDAQTHVTETKLPTPQNEEK